MTLHTLALLAAAAPGVEQGIFPVCLDHRRSQLPGGSRLADSRIQPNLYILRESGCTNYEKPFLYLFFGNERALLIDTGAGASDAAAVTQKLIAKWMRRIARSIRWWWPTRTPTATTPPATKASTGFRTPPWSRRPSRREQKAFGIADVAHRRAASISAAA